MDHLHWELSVLSRAINYKNLSGAAGNVGLSQPQLSRIISRLEQDLNLVLLDRSSRRKSGWTPDAFRLAETYLRHSRLLSQAVQQLQSDASVTQLNIGTLEGLIPVASDFCSKVFSHTKLQGMELSVYDLSELEEKFAKEELHMIFTCREPGKAKNRYLRNFGFQSLENVAGKTDFKVFSLFEHSTQTGKKGSAKENKYVLSNSLGVRKYWIEQFGAAGIMPSEVRKKKSPAEGELPVFLIASEMTNPKLWQLLEEIKI